MLKSLRKTLENTMQFKVNWNTEHKTILISQLRVLQLNGMWFIGREYWDEDQDGWLPYSQESVEAWHESADALLALLNNNYKKRNTIIGTTAYVDTHTTCSDNVYESFRYSI